MRKQDDRRDAAELGSCIRIAAGLAERAWFRLTRDQRAELVAHVMSVVEITNPTPAEPSERVH